MPRHVRTRDSDGGPLDPGGAPRRQWLTKWKTWAVSRLPGDAQRAVKVQLRVDVERALARYRIDDDEAEVRDVVGKGASGGRRRGGDWRRCCLASSCHQGSHQPGNREGEAADPAVEEFTPIGRTEAVMSENTSGDSSNGARPEDRSLWLTVEEA